MCSEIVFPHEFCAPKHGAEEAVSVGCVRVPVVLHTLFLHSSYRHRSVDSELLETALVHSCWSS